MKLSFTVNLLIDPITRSLKNSKLQSTVEKQIIDQSNKRLRAKSYQSHHSIDPIKDKQPY